MSKRHYVEISYTHLNGMTEKRLVTLENLQKAIRHVRNQKI